MSIEITAKLLNYMQKEIQELINNNVGFMDGQLRGSTEEEKKNSSKNIDHDLMFVLRIVQMFEEQLVELLKTSVCSL